MVKYELPYFLRFHSIANVQNVTKFTYIKLFKKSMKDSCAKTRLGSDTPVIGEKFRKKIMKGNNKN